MLAASAAVVPFRESSLAISLYVFSAASKFPSSSSQSPIPNLASAFIEGLLDAFLSACV